MPYKYQLLLFIFSFCICPVITKAQFANSRQDIAPHIFNPSNETPVDMDGDGDLDIFVVSDGYCSPTSGWEVMGWFENTDGQGSFSEFQFIAEGIGITDKATFIDWDDDGDLDIITASEMVYDGLDGIMLFEKIDDTPTYGAPQMLVNDFRGVMKPYFRDLDGDNDMDMVIEGGSPLRLYWFEKTAEGLSNPTQISTEYYNIRTIQFVDMDNDSDIDIMSGADFTFSTSTNIVWFENLDGLGNFSSEITINHLGGSIYDMRVADFNNNDISDLVYISEYTPKLNWLRDIDANNSSPEGTTVDSFFVIGSDGFMAVADINNNGNVDFITSSAGRIKWFENIDGNGTFTENVIVNNWASSQEVIPVDFDNDDDYDLLVSSRYNTAITWFENTNGQGDFFMHTIYAAPKIMDIFTMGDLSGDGLLDIIKSSGSENMHWFKQYENNENYYSSGIEINSKILNLRLGDLDNDNDLDILGTKINNSTATHEIVWHENTDGQGTFGEAVLISNFGAEEFEGITICDFDLDNDLDIIILSDSSNLSRISWIENSDSFGNFSSPITITSDIPFGVELVPVDFDNDGDKDIVYTSSYPHQIFFLENTDFNFSTIVLKDTVCDIPRNLRIGDLDNDNDLDIVLGGFEKLFWLENIDGMHEYAEIILHETPTSIRGLEVFDYDNNGHLDIISVDGVNFIEDLRLFHNVGGATFESQLLISEDIANLISYDIDLDNDLDLIYYNSTYKTFSLLENYSDDIKIQGKVYWDQNENGSLDTDELTLNQQQINITPNPIITWAVENVGYSFPVIPDTYDISCTPSNNWRLTTDSIVNVIITPDTESVEQNFGLTIASDSIFSALSITSAPTRCGFTVPFWINYTCNSYQLEDGFITLALDTLVTFIEAEPAPALITDTLLTWYFEDIIPTYSNQINLFFEIADAEFIGETIQMEAIMGTKNAMSLDTTSIDTTNFISEINCSYDPNDKLVEPFFDEETNYTLLNDEIHYTIRFQNTGTDTAFTIRIEDQLDANLDFETFRVLASSHSVNTTMTESGLVTFLFSNVLLPHSAIDEINSHGYIKYEINAKAELEDETIIQNSASIFFDFNPPIITNTVHNFLVSQFPINPVVNHPTCHDSNNGSIITSLVLPNLTYEWNNIISENPILDNVFEGEYTLRVFQPDGKIVFEDNYILEAPSVLEASVSSSPENGMNIDGMAIVSPEGGTPPYSYEWNTSPPQYTASISELSSGTYEVTVTDINECKFIIAVVVNQLVGTEENIKPISFSVSPNPSPDDVLIEFTLPTIQNWTLEIGNIDGKISKVYQAPENGSSSWKEIISLDNGIHYLTLKIMGQVVAKQIIIIH